MRRSLNRAFRLPQPRATWRWGLALICVMLVGCLAPRRITVIDTATYELKSFPPQGDTWYTRPLSMDREGDSILYLAESKGHLEIVKHDLNGRIVSQQPIPCFDRFLVFSHALSPDERCFAYYTSDRTNLFLYDMDSHAERLLKANIEPMRLGGDSLFWISDHEIVAVVDSKPDRGLAILKLDARTGKITGRIPFPVSDHGNVAVHAKRKLLAVAAFEWYAGVSVFDLETMTLVREIPNPNKKSILRLAWDTSGNHLVFRGGDEWLSVCSIEDGNTRRVIKMPDNEVCYFIGFINENTCAYLSHGVPAKSKQREPHLDFVDLGTGRLIKSISAAFNGGVFVICNGESLVCWTGYR